MSRRTHEWVMSRFVREWVRRDIIQICVRHDSFVSATRRICSWHVASHSRTSTVAHTCKLCRAHKCVTQISHVALKYTGMSHVTLKWVMSQANESCRAYEWIRSRTHINYVAHANASLKLVMLHSNALKWVMSHSNESCRTQMSHVALTNEFCRTHIWILLRTQIHANACRIHMWVRHIVLICGCVKSHTQHTRDDSQTKSQRQHKEVANRPSENDL